MPGADAHRSIVDDAIWPQRTCLVHGDLGAEPVLVAPGGDLAGVID